MRDKAEEAIQALIWNAVLVSGSLNLNREYNPLSSDQEITIAKSLETHLYTTSSYPLVFRCCSLSSIHVEMAEIQDERHDEISSKTVRAK